MVNKVTSYVCDYNCLFCSHPCKETRQFEREFERFKVLTTPTIENKKAINPNARLQELKNFIGNTSIHYHAVIDKIEELWQVPNTKAVEILNDLIRKGILFEPRPAFLG